MLFLLFHTFFLFFIRKFSYTYFVRRPRSFSFPSTHWFLFFLSLFSSFSSISFSFTFYPWFSRCMVILPFYQFEASIFFCIISALCKPMVCRTLWENTLFLLFLLNPLLVFFEKLSHISLLSLNDPLLVYRPIREAVK